MDRTRPTVQIELSEQQRQQLKEICGKDLDVLEFHAEQLEERIAPVCSSGNHMPDPL